MNFLFKRLRWHLIWLVPLVAAACLFFFPLAKPAYADAYKISFQSLNGEYGNPLFTNGEFAEDEYGHRILCLFGTLTDSTFSISNLTDKATATHYVVVSDLRASIGDETVSFIDEDGKVIVAPSQTAYNLLLSYPGENDNTVFSFYLYSLTSIEEKVVGEDTVDVVKGTYLDAIGAFSSTNQGSYIVNPKKVNVVLDDTYIADAVSTEGEYTIINRTYGDDPSAISFKTESGLAFSTHSMSTVVTIEGNDQYSDVGDYEIIVDNDNITITDADNNDITSYYKVVCDQSLKIRVNTLSLTAPYHTNDNYYSDEQVERDDDNKIISTPFDKNPWSKENVGGHVGWTAYFQPRLQVEESDLEDDRIKVTETDNYLYYDVTLTSVDAGGGRLLSLSNFTLDFDETMKENYKTKIVKRPVTIYIEGNAAMTYPEDLSISIKPVEFASNYGFAYSKINSLDIKIQNTPVTVTFEIKDFDFYANDADVLKKGDDLILQVGTYPVINPIVENDDRYMITFDPNTFYTVSPKPVSIVDIVRNSANVTSLVREGDKFVVERYAYGEKSGDLSVDFEFKDASVSDTAIFSLVADISLADGKPGSYSAVSVDSQNFLLTDKEYLSVLIEKVKLSLDYLSTYEYSRTAYLPLVSGNVSALEFDYEIKFASGKTYAERNALSSAPTGAGDYSFLVSLTEGADYYEFSNSQSSISGSYTITRRNVNVRIVVKRDSKVFGEVVTMKDVAYYETLYTEDVTKKGVLDGDEFGELRFDKDWNVKSAVPGDYTINNTFNNDNYRIRSFKYVYNNKEFNQNDFKFHVYKLSLSNFKSQAATSINERKVTATSSTVELPKISVYGVDLTNVVVAYREESAEEFTVGSSLKATDLKEGTSYTVAYVVKAGNNLVELSEDYLAEDDAKSVTTDLSRPDITQYPSMTTSVAIAVEILNYDAANSYAYKVDDGESVDVEGVIEAIEGETTKYVYLIGGLTPKTDYEITFIRKTQYTESESESKEMNTAAGIPAIAKSDLDITDNSVKVNVKEGVLDEDEVLGYEIIKINSGFLTFGSLSDKDSKVLADYFDENGEKATVGEGEEIVDLDSDSIYYVKYYVVGNDANNFVQSDPIYFELHTKTLPGDADKAAGILGIVSKYLLLGSTILFFILFIVCLIKFLSIKKKYRRA